jgi:hypothetical protein
MTDDEPVRISVIVPVRNRRDLLTIALDALDLQTRRDFEVIVVDDGSTDGADQVAADAVVAGRPVSLLRAGGAGAVAARTIGVAAATGEILAFTDSDCRPLPGWLEHGAGAIDSGADVVNGLTLPERPVQPLERSVSSATEGLYPTANMFFRRTTFDAVGGFDGAAAARLGYRHNERARGMGFGEDTILAWRIIRAGYCVEHVAEAEVRHHVFPADLVECLSRGWQSAAFPQLIAEVPELRPTMVHRRVLFGTRSRVPFYVTVAGAALRNRPAVAVGTAWWTLSRLREMRHMPGDWSKKLPLLPAELLIDAVVGTALVVGSVRAKKLLL